MLWYGIAILRKSFETNRQINFPNFFFPLIYDLKQIQSYYLNVVEYNALVFFNILHKKLYSPAYSMYNFYKWNKSLRRLLSSFI